MKTLLIAIALFAQTALAQIGTPSELGTVKTSVTGKILANGEWLDYSFQSGSGSKVSGWECQDLGASFTAVAAGICAKATGESFYWIMMSSKEITAEAYFSANPSALDPADAKLTLDAYIEKQFVQSKDPNKILLNGIELKRENCAQGSNALVFVMPGEAVMGPEVSTDFSLTQFSCTTLDMK